MREQLRNLYSHSVKLEASPAPWPRMIVSSIATTLPLIVGAINGHIALSIYGALMGYLLALNDHLGTLKQRYQIVTLTFLFLLSGFAIGFWAHDREYLFYLIAPALIYWVGILGGEGAEAERALLFLVISIVISFSSKPIPTAGLWALFYYSLFAYVTVLIAIPILVKFRFRKAEDFAGLRSNFKKTFNLNLKKHIHAFSYTFSAMVALAYAQYSEMEKGYWIVITVLLVMRSDRALSVYISFQRLMGTAFGVLAFDLILLFHPPVLFLIAAVSICSFVVPYALKRNYMMASFFITAFVVALLEIAVVHEDSTIVDVATPFLRLKATFIGCMIAICGTFFSKVLEKRLLVSVPNL